MSNLLDGKLYPPLLEGSLPAFTKSETSQASDEKFVITIPYTDNSAVEWQEGMKIKLLIKKVNNNTIIISATSSGKAARFALPKNKIENGVYYKVQLAYVDTDGEVGYYSTPGIMKCISAPEASISYNQAKNLITALFKPKNSGEYLYSYRFIIKDWGDNIIDDTGELIYNSSQIDDYGRSLIEYQTRKKLLVGRQYSITGEFRTGNNYVLTKTFSNARATATIESDLHTFKTDLIATNQYDNGYINLDLSAARDNLIIGKFILGRSSDKDDYTTEEILTEFELINEPADKHIYKDFYLEYGVTYRYWVKQINQFGIVSKPLTSNHVTALFEDMYLADENRQLKIKFNPQVSSFKTVKQESKIETLGSKYPFVLRNGTIDYKEIAISGLISVLTDEEDLFMEKSFTVNPYDTSLTDENIKLEKEFKLEVLNWLNDGKIKYFKSPSEGSYLLRLMNISLSPNVQLGRMLHTFSATGYEMKDLNFDSFKELGMMNKSVPMRDYYLSSQTRSKDETKTEYNFLNGVKYINIYDLNPEATTSDTKVRFKLKISGKEEKDLAVPWGVKSFHLPLNTEKDVKITIVNQGPKIRIEAYARPHINSTMVVGPTEGKDVRFNRIKKLNVDADLTYGQRTNSTSSLTGNIINVLENNNNNKSVSYFSYINFYINNIESNQRSEYYIKINGEKIDITLSGSLSLNNIDYIYDLRLSPGVVMDYGCCTVTRVLQL